MSVLRSFCGATALVCMMWTSTALAEPAKCIKGANLEVEWAGAWYAAVAIAGPNAQKQCKIHYEGYDASWDEWVGPERTRPAPKAATCNKGEKLLVEWQKAWYPAEIIGGPNDKRQCKIHYDGFESSWDEYITPNRMRRKMATGDVKRWCVKGNKLMVEWQGKYYAAVVVDGPNAQKQCKVHYPGYDASWDEYIGADRVF